MKHISLKHRSKDLSMTIPEQWDELTTVQLSWYVNNFLPKLPKIFPKNADGEINFDELYEELFQQIRIGQLYTFTGWPWKKFKNLTSEHLAWIIGEEKAVDWMFIKKNTRTVNPYPSVKVDSKNKLYGPGNDFENLTIDELRYTDAFYLSFKSSGNIDELDKMLSVIYRNAKENFDPKSPKSDGDISEEFNNHTVDFRIPIIKNIPLPIKYTILFWYEGCRNVLQSDFKESFESGGSDNTPNLGWTGVINSIAGAEMGTVKEVEKRLIREVLMYNKVLKIKADEIKRNTPE